MDLKFQKILYDKTLKQMQESKKYPGLYRLFKEQLETIKKEVQDYKKQLKRSKSKKNLTK